MGDAFWFKPKSYGYGATPTNWKGWVAVFAFVALVLAFTWPMMVLPALSGVEPSVSTRLALLVVVTLAFIYVCKSKTDGDWRWRWGETDDDVGPEG